MTNSNMPIEQQNNLTQEEEDFERIKSALMNNQRGRWFLEEYLNRSGRSDTETLLHAIQRIEKNLEQSSSSSEDAINPIRMTVMEMSDAIAQTRKEIATINPSEVDENQIMNATEELGAIVEATEMATNTILESAEDIQEAAWILREAGGADDQCSVIDDRTTSIYTACSFQDITGQRTTKVVQALCFIENRLNAMIEIWGLEKDADNAGANETEGETPERENDRPDAHLLNGPALAGEGLEQTDVDDVIFDQPQETDQSLETDIADTEMPPAQQEPLSEELISDTPLSDEIASNEISFDQTIEDDFRANAINTDDNNAELEPPSDKPASDEPASPVFQKESGINEESALDGFTETLDDQVVEDAKLPQSENEPIADPNLGATLSERLAGLENAINDDEEPNDEEPNYQEPSDVEPSDGDLGSHSTETETDADIDRGETLENLEALTGPDPKLPGELNDLGTPDDLSIIPENQAPIEDPIENIPEFQEETQTEYSGENPLVSNQPTPENPLDALDFDDILVNDIAPLNPQSEGTEQPPTQTPDATEAPEQTNPLLMEENSLDLSSEMNKESPLVEASLEDVPMEENSNKNILSVEEAQNEPDLDIDNLTKTQEDTLLG